ncbi:hypothetical protein DV736_g447, partial [Chaetothyriales sp. CBS 134916]
MAGSGNLELQRLLATLNSYAPRVEPTTGSKRQREEESSGQTSQSNFTLVALHESRRSTSAQVSALLRSLGGKDTTATTNNNTSSSGETNNQAELDAYDAKVYRSLVAMQADFDRQLRSLGVPFFAISHDLKIDKGELRELQKRMLALLEDLFAD